MTELNAARLTQRHKHKFYLNTKELVKAAHPDNEKRRFDFHIHTCMREFSRAVIIIITLS